MTDLSELKMFLVEGTIEADPFTNHCTIRTVFPDNGKPFSFDPQQALKEFIGREVRLVLVPLATVAQVEEAVKRAESKDATSMQILEVVDSPKVG